MAKPGIAAVFEQIRLLQSCPRELWLAYLMKFLESFAYFSFSMSLTVFLSSDFGFSDRRAGIAYGVLNALTSVYGLPSGFLIIDKLGVKWSLVFGCIVLFMGRFLLAFTTSHSVVAVCLYFLIPFGQAFGIPVLTIGIRRYTDQKSRPVAFSWFYVVMNLAALLASPSVDIIRAAVGEKCSPIPAFNLPCFSAYRILMLVGCIATLINLFIAWFFLRDISMHSASGQAQHFQPVQDSPFQILKEAIRSKRFWKFVAVVLLLTGVRLIYRHMDATFPKYMLRQFGPEAPFGTILGINPFCVIVLVPIVAAFSSHIRAFRMILVGALISGLSPVFLLLGPHYWNAILWVVVLSVGEAIWSPRLYEYSAVIAPRGKEGTYLTLSSVPLFLAPVIVGGMSGEILSNNCPARYQCNSFNLWLPVVLVSVSSPVLLLAFAPCLESDIVDSKHETLREDDDGLGAEPLFDMQTSSDSDADAFDIAAAPGTGKGSASRRVRPVSSLGAA